jgi:hypothetical protein
MLTDFTKSLGFSSMTMVSCLALLSACSASDGTGAATDLGRKIKVVPTPAPTPTPTPTTTTTSTTVYDTSVGNGVDANGFADLPLRSGAHRYFVNSTTGSNANGCAAAQQPGTPMKSIAGAMACIQDNNGDQVLVAQGMSYAEYLPNFSGRSGFSALYPTVLESYDPADPLNETKYGRAVSPSRPVLTVQQSNMVLGGGGASPSYIAIRGFDINPGNVTDSSIPFFPNSTGMPSYVLIENNLFRYTELNFDSGAAYGSRPASDHLIVRNNSIYGSWSVANHRQGIYLDYWTNYTLEDNVFYHNGWKVGSDRNDAMAAGGLLGDGVFRHSVYAQEDSSGTSRRNLMIDGPADCGSYRGDITFTENVAIDCPIGVGVGGGLYYNTQNPNGVNLQVSYNAFFGSADQDRDNLRGIGITSVNGKPGSSAGHNLFVRNPNPNGTNAYVFGTAAAFNQPSYMSYDHNVIYSWSPSAYLNGGSFPAQNVPTFTNNIWDAASSGSNSNNAGASFPNPYTPAQLYAALGFADKQGLASYVIEHPEAHIQRQARALLFAGYGLN